MLNFMVSLFHLIVWIALAIGLIVITSFLIAGIGTIVDRLELWRDERYIAKSDMVIRQKEEDKK